MGYPMTYARVVNRWNLTGAYAQMPQNMNNEQRDAWYNSPDWLRTNVAGDLRRLETDQRDERHLKEYAEAAQITPEQAKKVLDAFFAGEF